MTISKVLMILAVIVFAFAATGTDVPGNFEPIALGLALFAAAHI